MLCSVVFISSIALLTVPGIHGQSSSQSNTQDAVQSLVGMHEAWGLGASTPNASLVIAEASRFGGTIKLRLTATGIAKDGSYSLIAWSVTQKSPSTVLSGLTLGPSGLAICAGKPNTCGSADKPDDPIDLVFQPVPGEPIRLGLVAADGATKVFAKVVPLPLHGENQGCSADAVLLTPGAELVLIVGAGFTPNGELTMESESEGERHSAKGKANAVGRYVTAILPYKQGVGRGTVRVNLKAAKCAPSVSVPWGRSN